MKKAARIILITVAVITITLMVLTVGAVVALNFPSVRQRIMMQATSLLSEKLNTRVSMEQAEFSIFDGYVNLYGLQIDDLEQRKMLEIGKLSANLELRPLLDQRVVIEEIELSGLNAVLTKKTDSIPANYQFIIDAFKKDKKDENVNDNEKGNNKLELDVHHVKLADISIKYDKYDCSLHRATVKMEGDEETGKRYVRVKGLQAKWVADTKKGPVDCQVAIPELKADGKGKKWETEVKGLHYQTDNHKPRKNSGKPKRGFFDTGHLDVTADLRLDADLTVKDSVRFNLTELKAKDDRTGIDIRKVKADAVYAGGKLTFGNVTVQQKSTVLNVNGAVMTLPNKSKGIGLSYQTGTITGRTCLQDISHVFAPVLKQFTLPLNLSLTMSGTDSTMQFRNIKVFTDEKGLTIAATGDISHLKEKELLNVHFNVNSMYARNGEAEKVISQFPVKKMMMKQLGNLGNLTYTGDFSVVWKKESFRGLLHTDVGDLQFNFAIDENRKYVDGKASTENLALGHVMNIEKMGIINASAQFSIDISKPRTAIMRKKLGGKLPIGTVSAVVNDCAYMGIHVKHVTADIKSNGAVATGDVKKTGKVGDLSFSFSFTDTNEMHKMKITHPGLKVHWPWEKKKKQ